jgi:hypothetical protein
MLMEELALEVLRSVGPARYATVRDYMVREHPQAHRCNADAITRAALSALVERKLVIREGIGHGVYNLAPMTENC